MGSLDDRVAIESSQSAPGHISSYELIGKQIGRYLVQQRLGSGGVATVYRAYDQVQGQSVALKLLLPHADERTLDRFRREAFLAGALRHPHIVRILQVGSGSHVGSIAYIAMELVEGESLAALLARTGKLHPGESCTLLEPIARALAFAHQQGIIHRDVKPSNILLRPANRGAGNSVVLESLDYPVVPLLSDFGIARFLDAPELTSTGRTVGTPAFMAPEQCSGNRELDGRADIYALGAVLYRCVVGRTPFVGNTTQILHAHVYEPLTIEEELARVLPEKVLEILRRSLAKSPSARYADAAEMADALLAAAEAARLAEHAGDLSPTRTLIHVPAARPLNKDASSVVVLAAATSSTVPEEAAGLATQESVAARSGVESRRRMIPTRWAWLGLVLLFLVGVWGGYWLSERAALLGSAGGEATRPDVPQVNGAPTQRISPDRVTPVPEVAETEQASPSLRDGVTASVVTAPPTPSGELVEAGTAAVRDDETRMPSPLDSLPVVIAPTSTPTDIPSERPTEETRPTATATPEAASTTPVDAGGSVSITVTVEATATPLTLEGIVTACAYVMDPVLAAAAIELAIRDPANFACPSGDALHTAGERLTFEHGSMLRLQSETLVYIYYAASDEWELVASSWREGDELPDLGSEPEMSERFLPQGIFAALWSDERRKAALGFAVQPEPQRFAAVQQKFQGGVLIGDAATGEVEVFPLARLRL